MRLTKAAAGGLALAALTGGSALAQQPGHIPLASAVHGLAPLLQGDRDETAIRQAFCSLLNREPTSRELSRYRVLMDEYGWTARDVRRDLRERPDYQRYSRTRGFRPDAVIRRAYQDILGRDPDAEGLSHYRTRMIDEGWTDLDVREALRRSDEYASGAARTRSADRIIRRAYQDVLRREPDPAGLEAYRRNVIERGWEEHDIRQALRRSPENQARRTGVVSRPAVTEAQAEEMVRRAYRSVLDREPDAAGMNEYRTRILRDGWTEADLVRTLRDSDEYRRRNQ